MTEFTPRETDLIIEALRQCATRHESQARFNPLGKNVGEHEQKAMAMRNLGIRLIRAKERRKLDAKSAI